MDCGFILDYGRKRWLLSGLIVLYLGFSIFHILVLLLPHDETRYIHVILRVSSLLTALLSRLLSIANSFRYLGSKVC